MSLRLALSAQCIKDYISFGSVVSIYRINYFSTSLKLPQSDTSGESTTPWYLRKDNTSKLEPLTHEKFPELPNDAPESVGNLVELLVKKYGLTNLKIYDLASLPLDHPKHVDEHSSERFTILASGKSEKHIYKASYELKQHIKHEFGYLPRLEGMTSNSISSRTRRRLAKRARQGPPATHNDFGIGANLWVRCELGVGGAVVHILSDDRRLELNLESLYEEDAPEQNFVPEPPRRSYEDTESVFYGLRKHFHTSSMLHNVAALRSIAKDCTGERSERSLAQYKNSFDSKFAGFTIDEWSEKFAFYKTLHLENPHLVTFTDVEQCLLSKHSCLKLLGEAADWNQEIVHDVIKYMELLLDTRESITGTEKFERLSIFISNITAFSRDEIHFFAVDKFQALLWSLTSDEYLPIDAARLHSILRTGEGLLPETHPIAQDPKAAQNVRELIRSINFSKRGAVPLWLREQMLYTYASTRNWSYFWKEWDMIQQSLNTASQLLHMQTKVIILLAVINDKIALRDFFCKFWDKGSSFSFMDQWEKVGALLDTKQEKIALKKALNMIQSNHGSSSWFENARIFATTL